MYVNIISGAIISIYVSRYTSDTVIFRRFLNVYSKIYQRH